MLELDKINPHVLLHLRNREYSDAQIEQMSPEEAFDEFLIWNGIINYTSDIIEAIDSLRAAEVKK